MSDDQNGIRSIGRIAAGAALISGALIGLQTLFPLVVPRLPGPVGWLSLAACGLILVFGALLQRWPRRAKSVRRWSLPSGGQGWLETRVRDGLGSELIVACNPGDTADKIALHISFVGPRRPRRADVAEVVFTIDSVAFEWDVPDTGETDFHVENVNVRDLEPLRAMIGRMRRGRELKIEAVGLSASFSLDGAFDALEPAERLGDGEA